MSAVAGDASTYAQTVRGHQPEFWWRMHVTDGRVGNSGSATGFAATPVGKPGRNVAAPTGRTYPDFSTDNTAVRIRGGAQYLRVTDVKGRDGKSPLRFDQGDSITIEAWVNPDRLTSGFPYIVGKGRTYNKGYDKRNQNYALRLAPRGSGAALSFYFVDRESKTEEDGHRWTSKLTFPVDGYWHHVALTFTFGSDKIAGWIDGKKTNGTWDLGGKTNKPPIVDDDELWIGSSMAGVNTFNGRLDEVAIYRRTLTDEEIRSHVKIRRRDEILQLVKAAAYSAPGDHVRVQIYEGAGGGTSWKFRPGRVETEFAADVFASGKVPRKYNARGLIADRNVPLLLHFSSRILVPPGEYQLRVRSLSSSRLYVDDELLTETDFLSLPGNGHNALYKMPAPESGELSLPAAHDQKVVSWISDGRPHVFSHLVLVGRPGRPAEPGEPAISIGRTNEPGFFLAPGRKLPFTDAGWLTFQKDQSDRLQAIEKQTRHIAAADERDYWDARHQFARQFLLDNEESSAGDSASKSGGRNHPIDEFLNRELQHAGIKPAATTSDEQFLRRLCLDICGIIPSSQQRSEYFADAPESRRWALIDRLLDDRGWADHWVGYWQDVLAENPGLTKPRLNNSGPFRFFIHESFLDNKPFDRFVSELISMEGSKLHGGPAGFAMVTNNDSPMAARAHVLGTAFLGIQMKCARCHDAPSHESSQQDLFNIAAMLNRKPLAVPKSSTVPGSPEELAEMVVQVSLKPGQKVRPDWPFQQILNVEDSRSQFPTEFIRNPDDPREQLALRLTHPANKRFAQVIVNRLWKRYFGRGLVEPLDDWEAAESSHAELLDFLAGDFVLSGYNLKHTARLIFTSDAYQRVVDADNSDESRRRRALFGSPVRRRMTAEQIADSVYRAVGKSFNTEELCVNTDGQMSQASFLNLGQPRRAWEFVSTSNERERPSMSLPHAQAVVDLLQAYGWRQNRQDPVNERDDAPNPLQPMAIANGQSVQRAIDISDHAEICELCLQNQSVTEYIEAVFQRVLTRRPTQDELATFGKLLEPGFQSRVNASVKSPPKTIDRSPLTWSNNLDPGANKLGMERDAIALRGDRPTKRLNPDWRERAEDMLWVLLNSPEFVFIP